MEQLIKHYLNLSLENIKYKDENGIEKEEQWKDIIGYEGQYMVSDLGRVKSLDRIKLRKDKYGNDGKQTIKARIRRQYLRSDGYLSFGVSGNRSIKVHRVVAKFFIPNPNNKETVNHTKGIRTDNRVSELEWATVSEQNTHAYRVLDKHQVNKGKVGKDCVFSVKVKCLNDGKIFDSMGLATSYYNLPKGAVSNNIRLGYNLSTYRGYKFALVN